MKREGTNRNKQILLVIGLVLLLVFVSRSDFTGFLAKSSKSNDQSRNTMCHQKVTGGGYDTSFGWTCDNAKTNACNDALSVAREDAIGKCPTLCKDFREDNKETRADKDCDKISLVQTIILTYRGRYIGGCYATVTGFCEYSGPPAHLGKARYD